MLEREGGQFKPLTAATGDSAMPTPEEEARQLIDSKLAASGWVVQTYKHMNLGAGPGLAVSEFPPDAPVVVTAAPGHVLRSSTCPAFRPNRQPTPSISACSVSAAGLTVSPGVESSTDTCVMLSQFEAIRFFPESRFGGFGNGVDDCCPSAGQGSPWIW